MTDNPTPTWRGKRFSEMSDDEIRQMCAPRGGSSVADRYAGADTCECGAPIEELDGGNSYTYWVHLKRGDVEYDHSAVPERR